MSDLMDTLEKWEAESNLDMIIYTGKRPGPPEILDALNKRNDRILLLVKALRIASDVLKEIETAEEHSAPCPRLTSNALVEIEALLKESAE